MENVYHIIFDKEHMDKLAERLYDFLRTNGCLKESPQFDPEVEWLIVDREKCQCYSNFRILAFLHHEDNVFLNLCKRYNPAGTFEKELEIMPYGILANTALSQYEKLKRVFRIALDFKKIDPKLKDNPTYGTIISKLENKGLQKDIVVALDNKLRNIVAHGDWYVQDHRFTYMDDGKKSISYEDLSQRVNNFIRFSNVFYRIYWSNHLTPEASEFSKQKMIDDAIDLFWKLHRRSRG